MSEYWGNDAGRYLVTIIPFAPPGPGATSIGGTGRGDAFAFFATTNALPEMLDRLMTHEMAHSWVNARIGGFSDTVPEAEQFWLSEGFTDFTSWRALVRAGVWTPEQYFAQFNDALREYDASPLRAAPNKEAARLFWTDEKAQRLAYLRGMLFAHWADDRLRRAPGGSSMRDLLLTMQGPLRQPAAMLLPCSVPRRSAATRRSAKASPASSIAANRLRCPPTCSPRAARCANSNDWCSIAASMSTRRSRTTALSLASPRTARHGRPGCATA